MSKKIEPPNLTAAALVDIAEQTARLDPHGYGSDPHVRIPTEARIPIPQPAPEPEVIGKIPFAKTTDYVQHDGADRRNALAQGLARFDDMKRERDQLERDLLQAREKIHMMQITINELNDTRATIESRINTCVLQRDEAVREAGACMGVIDAIALVCNKFLEKNAKHQD